MAPLDRSYRSFYCVPQQLWPHLVSVLRQSEILVENCDFLPRYAISMAYTVVRCLSVRPLCSCIVSKRVIISSNLFHSGIARPFYFFHSKPYCNILNGSSNAGDMKKIAISTNANKKSYPSSLSNDTIFNDLGQPVTHMTRSRHYLTLNISENGKRQRHRLSYNRIPVGTYTCPT